MAELEESLRAGWGDFTGRVVPRQPPKPLGVPAAYIMRPYEIRMAFKRGSWCTVHLELGHDEIGDTGDAVPFLADDLVELFAILGLPRPAAVPVLAVHHQIAQKLHACTEAVSDRAHDLVDLQLLVAADQPDLVVVAETARRLFISRNAQAWPPRIRTRPTWPELYEAAAVDLDVLPDLEAAVDWTNNLILAIDAACPRTE